MNVVFCVGLITILSVVAFALIMFFAWMLSGGSDYLDSDDIVGAMGLFIVAFIIVGSIIFTKFMYDPEQFGYTKINYEHMEEILDESN